MGLAGVLVAGGMSGESTSVTGFDKPLDTNSARPQVEVKLRAGELTVTRGFAGLFGAFVLMRHDRHGGCGVCRESLIGSGRLGGDARSGQRVAERFCTNGYEIRTNVAEVDRVPSSLDAAHA